MKNKIVGIVTFLCLIVAGQLQAYQYIVNDTAEFKYALKSAEAGNEILLSPGQYRGNIYIPNLRGVTIRSEVPDDMAIINGGKNGLHFVRPVDVTIKDLIIQNFEFNGLNIDDANEKDGGARNIRLENLVIRNVGVGGNHDGIKLSGVNNVTVANVKVLNWGGRGSAIDMVGVHNSLIENSLFINHEAGVTGAAIQIKGGSKNVIVRANKLDLEGTKRRAINIGGNTGRSYFRFIDGDSGYESRNITVEGNVIIGGRSAFNFVGSDSSTVKNNYVIGQVGWLVRILQETTAPGFVPSRRGQVYNNIFIYGNKLIRPINIGPNTAPATFRFRKNHWYNEDNPSQPPDFQPVIDEADGSCCKVPRLNQENFIQSR